ncbi:ribonuclease H-like domain-containing protein [Tanacetum coccineum]
MVVVANLLVVVVRACVQFGGSGCTLRGGDIEGEEVALVDGVFEVAFGALGDSTWFGNGSFSGCHGGLWWLIMDEEDDEQSGLSLEEKIIVLLRRSGNDVFLIHNDGWMMMRQSTGFRHSTITSGISSLFQGKWTHDPIDDIVNAIVKMRIMFYVVSKNPSQEHAIRNIGIWCSPSTFNSFDKEISKIILFFSNNTIQHNLIGCENDIFAFDGTIRLDTFQLKKSINIVGSRKIVNLMTDTLLLKVPRKNNMYSVDLKNIVPKGGLTCHFAKATSDESKLWHRKLGHLNFKTMNNLVKGNLVRGLPSKLFENDQTCVACQKGKQHRACLESVEEKLEFYKKNEPVYVEKINGLKWDIQVGEITIRELRKKLEKIQKEKDSIQFNVDKFENASKSLDKIIECQIVDNCKKGLGYEKYNAVPPPYTGNFMPPILNLSFTGLDEFVNEPVVENSKAMSSEEKPKVVRKNNDAPIIKE